MNNGLHKYCISLDSGWGLWTPWSTCSKKCGLGQQGRKRICMPYQHTELRHALKHGKLSTEQLAGLRITCQEKDQKETQHCSKGPCDSVGWTRNKETGKYEDAGQRHGQTHPNPEAEAIKEERRKGKGSDEIMDLNDPHEQSESKEYKKEL